MDSQPLAERTIKNSIYSVAGYLLPIAFSVFITPVVVHRLGATSYGVYVLVYAIFGFFGLIDLGLGAAQIKFISQYSASGEMPRMQKFLNSILSLYAVIGFLGLVAFIVIGLFFLSIFHVSGLGTMYMLGVCVLMGLVFCLNTIGQIYVVAPTAMQRYDIATKLSLFQLTLFNFGLLGLVLTGHGLQPIFLWLLISIILFIFVNRFYFRRLLPGISLRPQWDMTEIKTAYRFGIYVAISNLASMSLFQLDRFLIPILLGPSSLTFYTLPGNVAQKVSGVGSSVTQILFPITSSLAASDHPNRVGLLYRRVVQNISVLAAAGSLACAIFAYPILHFWLGTEFANQGWKILVILAGTHYILALYSPLMFSLLGLGKSKFLMFLSIGLATLNAILILLLVPHYKIEGAAWAYLLGTLPLPFVSLWVERKIFGLTGSLLFYIKLYAKLIVIGVIVYAVAHWFLKPLVVNLPSLIGIGLATVLLYGILYWVFGFLQKEDKQLFLGYAKRLKLMFVFKH